MCRRTTCKKCGKPSWAGCGAHVEMVLGDVPKSERCRCNELPSRSARPASMPKASAGMPADESPVGRFKAWLKG